MIVWSLNPWYLAAAILGSVLTINILLLQYTRLTSARAKLRAKELGLWIAKAQREHPQKGDSSEGDS